MNTRVNRKGLGRSIPSDVRREVRRRSKFGCVVCRSGFYEYEHIVPFTEIERHDPEHICCLCEECHSRVTRGQWSKDLVRHHYLLIQQQSMVDAREPKGPLDFHSGAAVLTMGDLEYAPAIESVLRYFGDDLIKLYPGKNGEPGRISAVFTDDQGNAILELDENEWIGSLAVWDISVEGRRITVRTKKGRIALQLRLEPPGRIVVERLDMRIGAHHILVSEASYAVGAYLAEGDPVWFSPCLRVTRATPQGVALEISTPQKLLDRYEYFNLSGRGTGLVTANQSFIVHSPAGVMVPELGICIASFCNFNLYSLASGCRSLDGMREAVFFNLADEMRKYMAR